MEKKLIIADSEAALRLAFSNENPNRAQSGDSVAITEHISLTQDLFIDCPVQILMTKNGAVDTCGFHMRCHWKKGEYGDNMLTLDSI